MRANYSKIALEIGQSLTEKQCLKMVERFENGYEGNNSEHCELCKKFQVDVWIKRHPECDKKRKVTLCTMCPCDVYGVPGTFFFKQSGCVVLRKQYETIEEYQQARIKLYTKAAKIAKRLESK